MTRSGSLNIRPLGGRRRRGEIRKGWWRFTWCWYDTVLVIALCNGSWIVSVIIAAVIVTLVTYTCLKGGRGDKI